eukprot:s5537_g4.t1
MQYSLYLRSSPHCAAALVSTKEAEDGETKQSILKRMEAEWQVVLSMESKQASALVLATSCYHTRYQHYRETMGCLEMHNFKMTPESKEMVSAWNPSFCQSAALESMFGEMTHAVKQAGRADCGSLPNLHAVSVRSLFRRVCKQEGSPKALELSKDDWVGPQAAGIKPKVFSPTSAPTCFVPAAIKHAVRLKELPYKFAGPLPEQQSDETRVPCRSQDDWWDPLLQGLNTPALTFDIGRRFRDVLAWCEG